MEEATAQKETEVSVCGSFEDVRTLEAFVAGTLQIRPTISDRLRIGFYLADIATQTDESEILTIKELTNATQMLADSFKALKRDLVLHRIVLGAQCEEQIQEQAVNLYLRTNGIVRDLEAVHKKKLSMMRQSFRQQLADALARMKGNYEKYYLCTTDADGDLSSDTKEDLVAKLLCLSNQLRLKDSQIHSLEIQLWENQARAYPKQDYNTLISRSKSQSAKKGHHRGSGVSIFYEPEVDPEKERIREENKEFKEEINIMKKLIVSLKEQLIIRGRESHDLEVDVRHMKEKMEKAQKTIEKLVSALEKAKTEVEKEKYSSALMIQAQQKPGVKVHQTAGKEKQILLPEHTQKQEQAVTKDTEPILQLFLQKKEEYEEKRKIDSQIRKLEETIEKQKKTIESLKKQLQQNAKVAEKKIGIIKKSMHAIKDEMFLRYALHRQAVTFQQAPGSYASGAPRQFTVMPNRLPLPAYTVPQIVTPQLPEKERAEFDIGIAAQFRQYAMKENEMQIAEEEEFMGSRARLLPSPAYSEAPTEDQATDYLH